ncbi:SOS response-associated peptidase family protein [Streptomyces sioyaensis]|uniref:SOS response-associated peptidase family protein n=1 Tax=Streptomyces sioyaensis TaxID=67364 RepID=UPI0033E416FA
MGEEPGHGHGFYEWQTVVPTKTAKARKQPYFISAEDGQAMALADLYAAGRRPRRLERLARPRPPGRRRATRAAGNRSARAWVVTVLVRRLGSWPSPRPPSGRGWASGCRSR